MGGRLDPLTLGEEEEDVEEESEEQHPSKMLVMSFNSLTPLRQLAMERAIDHGDQQEVADLPTALKEELESLRQWKDQQIRS